MNSIFIQMKYSFYWGLQVIKNIVHCTAAGVVGEWWYHIAPEKPVQNAAYRSITTAFGSICLGSLVIAVLSSLRTVLHYFKRKPSRRLNACLESLMYQLERSAQYFNMYAYCQVALYGKDLQSAGFDTISLFRQRGWTAIVNDQLISGVLRVGCLIVGKQHFYIIPYEACNRWHHCCHRSWMVLSCHRLFSSRKNATCRPMR